MSQWISLGKLPQLGGPLGQGEINKEGYIVCPWHQMFMRLCADVWKPLKSFYPEEKNP